MDLLLTNAQIYPLTAENETYSACLIHNGKIVKLFDRDPHPEGVKANVLDAQGATVLPGLIDGHFHFMPTAGLHEMALNVMEVQDGKLVPEDLDAFRIKLQQYAATRPAHLPILCFNYIVPGIKEDRLPFRSELDAYVPDRAIIVLSMDGHSSAYSTKGLQLMGINPEGHSGLLDGEAHEFQIGRLNGIVMKYVSLGMLLRGMQYVISDAIQHGVVGIHCLEGFEDSPNDLVMRLFTTFAPVFPLYLRLFPQYIHPERVAPLRKKMIYPRVGGCGSWEQDGSIGSRTAGFYEPFADNPNNFGKCYYSPEKMTEIVDQMHRAGYQITSHAIGTKALDVILAAYDTVLQPEGYQNRLRHRIDHFEFPSAEQVDWAISRMHLLITAQPGYSWMDETYQKGYRKYLQPEQFARQIPLRKIVEKGGILIGGSDSPVQHLNPFTQLHGMINFPLEHEQLSIFQAFRTYTANAAYSTFEEQTRGTLEVGKNADFIVLDRNPFTIPKEKIIDLRVKATYLQGRRLDPKIKSTAGFLAYWLTQSKKKI
jgi:predicted amidohydrolase YtcJ